MQDLEDLNEMMVEFATLVHQQGETVDRIEDNITVAEQNIEEGTSHLAKVARLKMLMLPLAGAVICGAVAGPIGLLSGFKLGGMAAAVGGSVIGRLILSAGSLLLHF